MGSTKLLWLILMTDLSESLCKIMGSAAVGTPSSTPDDTVTNARDTGMYTPDDTVTNTEIHKSTHQMT